MIKLIEKIKSWFTRRKKAVTIETPKANPIPVKRKGRGAYFTNNRKRTRGRNIQYIQLVNGGTRVIKHETL